MHYCLSGNSLGNEETRGGGTHWQVKDSGLWTMIEDSSGKKDGDRKIGRKQSMESFKRERRGFWGSGGSWHGREMTIEGEE